MRVTNTSIPFALSLLALTACGGGGGGGGNANNQPLPSASLSSLSASPLTAPADGSTEILLTAVVRDVAGDALGGRTVRFDVIGNGVTLQPQLAIASPAGIATARMTSTLPGSATVSAVVSPDSDSVQLDQTLQVTFTPVNAPVFTGPARYEDVDGDGVANAGDRVVMTFSEPVVVSGALATDFALPVQDDSFGAGATVGAGDRPEEVAITLGAGARLRSRGQFASGVVTNNAPSGIELANGQGVLAAVSLTPAAASVPVDVAPGVVAQTPASVGGQVLAVGDLNGDAMPDCVVSDNGMLTPFENVAGSLVAATPSNGQPAVAVAIANLNRIGNAEVVTGDSVGVRIWNQTGPSQGTPSLQENGFIASGAANDLLIEDVDADGFPDIVIGTSAGVVVAIHQRNLGNTYAIGQSLFVGPVDEVLAADLDGDGDRDVLARSGSSVRLLRNDSGTLVEESQITLATAAAMSVGDTDGDGVQELLLSGQGAASLFTRQANGSYVGAAVDVAAEQAELVDLDGDAFADIAARTAAGLVLLANDRSGAFVPFQRLGAAAGSDVAAVDLDRDGDLDLLLLEQNELAAFGGSVAGTFGDTVLAERQQLGTSAVSKQELVDVDGDGQEDRVVLTQAGAEVWLGDGAGGFSLAGSFGSVQSQDPTAFAFGDLDGDGDADCVLGFDVGAANEVFVNDGQGQFSFAWGFSAQACRSLAMTDFDQDGDLDVFVGNDGDNELYRNDTVGGTVQLFLEPIAFANVLPVAVGNETIVVLPFDFDRDGDEDVFVINGGDLTAPQNAYVLRRSGVGYTLGVTLNASLLATGATIADVDGDGREDLAIAQLSSNGSATVKWFRGFNTSLSTLSTNVASNGQYFSRSLIVADIDGDGRNDFVIGDVSVSNQPIAVLRQRADGTFEVGQEFATTRLESVDAGDFDNDGDVDLVTVETTGPSRVLENR